MPLESEGDGDGEITNLSAFSKPGRGLFRSLRLSRPKESTLVLFDNERPEVDWYCPGWLNLSWSSAMRLSAALFKVAWLKPESSGD